jgi:hypothetical protein
MADDRTKDQSWRNCVGTWDRLKWARMRRFETAKEAAIALGEKEGTYRSYERQPDSSKHTPLDHQNAAHFAKRFGVRWEWLLLGEGSPWRDADERRERILDLYDQAAEADRDFLLQTIERLLKRA